VHEALRPEGHFVFTIESQEDGASDTGWGIGSSGRYRHGRRYVAGALAEAGFVETDVAEVTLRTEADAGVPGWVVTATREPATTPAAKDD
jgi:predicted TPR repeat methyltransferase